MSIRDDLLNAGRRASEVLAEYGARDRIDSGYTRIDPELIAGVADVVVVYRKMQRLLGGFIREENANGILVNFDRPRGLVHMTCAHELGHFFLGHSSTADETVDYVQDADVIEQQANQFAYSLLSPSWLVAATMRQRGWSREHLRIPSIVYQLSLRLGTSFTAMVWSLVRLGHLARQDAERLVAIKPVSVKRDALSGKLPKDAAKDVWILNKADKDRILEPGTQDEFVVDLPNHAGSGHLWSIDQLRSAGFTIKPVLKDGREPAPQSPKKVTVGGGAATMRYSLVLPVESTQTAQENANSVGPLHRVVEMLEAPPWQSGTLPNDRFGFTAEFDVMKDGLSQTERDRRLSFSRGSR